MKPSLIPLIVTTALILSGAGCSFKEPDDKKSGLMKEEFRIDQHLDSDGDGRPDHTEHTTGGNPFVAEVPIFQGDFFQEMKVTTHFYNFQANKQESISFQVRKDIIFENGTPIEERDFLDKGSQFLIEQHHLLAKKNNSSEFHNPSNLSIDDIGYYSPPRMNDLKIFPFSQRVYDLSQGSEFEEIEFTISNRINFKYHEARTYTDIIIDLFWYDSIKSEFVLVGTDFLKGVYQFNQDYSVPLTFSSNQKPLVKEISENGGRFLYIKVRDFKIVEPNRFYKQILTNVLEKSIPVIFSDEEKISIVYVGTNGKSAQLKEILATALNDEVQVLNSKIVRVGAKSDNFTLERDPYGASGSVEWKWHLLTNEITNGPFTYSFAPMDLITLSFISSNRPFALIPSYFSTVISSNNPRELKTLRIKANNLLDIRLNFRPQEVTVPVNSALPVSPCNHSSISRACFSYKYTIKKYKGVQAVLVTSLVYITFNSIEFRLDKLLEEKHASFRIKNSEVIEIKFNPSILTTIPESSGLTMSITSKNTVLTGCSGQKVCESVQDHCNKFHFSPPTCEESGKSSSYNLIDQTKKTLHPVSGETFFSIEYI